MSSASKDKMISTEHFDIINILGSSILSATYKVKDKKSGKICVLKGIPLEQFSEQENKYFMKKFKTRKEIKHPNILEFFGSIEEKEIFYNVEEYCHFGNLENFIEKDCILKEKRITETLLSKILFQTALAFKTVESFCGELCTKTIFLDEEFNVKLYNFYTDGKNFKQKEPKMSHLGIILFEIATLKKFDKATFEKDLQYLTYSNNFVILLNYMLKDYNDLKKNVNKILCHPTVLLKTSQWTKDTCYLDAPSPLRNLVSYEEVFENNNIDSDRLEKLRKREANVQMKEHKLKDWERKLEQKEKKLLIMERNVKEKLQQAELYLKRSREVRSTSSGSSKSSTISSPQSSCPSTKKMSYEDLNDSLYVSCGDSIIERTSAKLNVEKIEKPKNFVRTMSERRIRFKTSPLKENRFNRKSTFRTSLKGSKIEEENIKSKEISTQNKENIAPPLRPKSQLFQDKNLYENDFPKQIKHPEFLENKHNVGRKIGWTEESKKYAFELLKMMNSTNSNGKSDNDSEEVQHTYL